MRVGRKPRSLAPYYLASQADVDGLLAELVELPVRAATLDRGVRTRVHL